MKAQTKRPRGRPKGATNRVSHPPETRARARSIYEESQHLASDGDIARQLAKEGFGEVGTENIGIWRRKNRWADTEAKTRHVAQLGEAVRQAVQVRVPDDLDAVEQASLRLAATGRRLAEHIERQIPNIKVETPEGLEIVSRCMRDMLHTQLTVGKALQDLRLLRVSSAFGADQPRDGEIIPPDRREREPHPPLNAQEAVVSNFMDG